MPLLLLLAAVDAAAAAVDAAAADSAAANAAADFAAPTADAATAGADVAANMFPNASVWGVYSSLVAVHHASCLPNND